MPATIIVVAAAVIVWVVLVAMGAPILSAHVTIAAQQSLTRNATAIAAGSWWRGATAVIVNLGAPALVFVMALVVVGGLQVERTYGTLRYVAVFVPSALTGVVVALLVEPAHAFNAGTSAAAFGVGAAAAIDLLRRGVPAHRTFWIPVLIIYLILGFIFPAGITWGAHVGGIAAGALTGTVLMTPDHTTRWRPPLGLALAAIISVAAVAGTEPAARHTVRHGPVLIGLVRTNGPVRRAAHHLTAVGLLQLGAVAGRSPVKRWSWGSSSNEAISSACSTRSGSSRSRRLVKTGVSDHPGEIDTLDHAQSPDFAPDGPSQTRTYDPGDGPAAEVLRVRTADPHCAEDGRLSASPPRCVVPLAAPGLLATARAMYTGDRSLATCSCAPSLTLAAVASRSAVSTRSGHQIRLPRTTGRGRA